jgi:hypothetical protein
VFLLQTDLFGSLNDSGLLSRAEALVAVDMKHPIVSSSCQSISSPSVTVSGGFSQIKTSSVSDMMYAAHLPVASAPIGVTVGGAVTNVNARIHQVRTIHETGMHKSNNETPFNENWPFWD